MAAETGTLQDEELRYPIGRFRRPEQLTPEERRAMIEAIAYLPAELHAAVEGLSPEQLDTPYRPGGWTVRQVVHHVPDSHLNAYIRFKLALTEDEPTIRTYHEERWAELPEARTAALRVSLTLLEAVHARWIAAIAGVGPEVWARTWIHPDSGRMTLDDLLALYAWHGRHHVAHITSLRRRMGW
jgi:uncharacterized damage-inducible protein DinB